MNKLYILEGADGTGKTTLSNEILAQTKGHLLHCTWNKDWDIQEYFKDVYESALNLLEYQDVVIDRFATSDEVYANAYRNGATFDSDEFILNLLGDFYKNNPDSTKFIYCTNENVIKNHEANKKIREEMFEDMSPVVREYEKYMGKTALQWIVYDFNKVNMKEFVKELIK